MSLADELLDWAELRGVLAYDPETGHFTRLKGCREGRRAAILRKTGYLQVTIGRRFYIAHRLAWFYMHGKWPQGVIDHINGVRDDNRIANLRDVPQSINMQNRKRPQANNKVGLLGVTEDPKRGLFAAHITICGKATRIGSFVTAQEAHEAYLNVKRVAHPGCTL